MAEYKPQLPFTVPMMLLIPTYETIKGVRKKKYPENISDCDVVYCSFKTYGGTERIVNDLYSIEDTANIETWYRPDIKSDCRLATTNGAIYEIINEPENINCRNQFLKFKVKRMKGGA